MSRPFHYRDWLDVLLGAFAALVLLSIFVTFLVWLVLVNISLITS